VSKATKKPLIPYNVPSRTAVDMSAETSGRVSQLPHVAAIKEAVPKMERIRELRALCRDGFSILSGDDATAREAVLEGAQGVISVTANVAPKVMADIMSAAASGDKAKAAALDSGIKALHDVLFVEANPIPVKWALWKMGLMDLGIRLPLTELSASHHDGLASVLRASGVLS
jgi:4-hydroxy-tetrahydrodipicolinate synthase